MMATIKKYFAVLSKRTGYVLDFYPEEKERYQKENGKYIIGEYETYEQAQKEIIFRLKNEP